MAKGNLKKADDVKLHVVAEMCRGMNSGDSTPWPFPQWMKSAPVSTLTNFSLLLMSQLSLLYKHLSIQYAIYNTTQFEMI